MSRWLTFEHDHFVVILLSFYLLLLLSFLLLYIRF